MFTIYAKRDGSQNYPILVTDDTTGEAAFEDFTGTRGSHGGSNDARLIQVASELADVAEVERAIAAYHNPEFGGRVTWDVSPQAETPLDKLAQVTAERDRYLAALVLCYQWFYAFHAGHHVPAVMEGKVPGLIDTIAAAMNPNNERAKV